MPRAKPKKPKSPSTPMPYAPPLDLGRYVTLRRRADGTCRVFFQVPARLRPSDWPSLIALPRAGRGRGDLSDAQEVALIQSDARTLYDDLTAARAGILRPEPKGFDALIRKYQASSAWTELALKTQKSYSSYLNHIRRWSELCTPTPLPARVTRANVDTMLSTWNEAPVTKKHVRKVMRLIMETARALGWRTDNPCDGIRLKVPKSKAKIWEQADVDAYVAAAETGGHTSIALMVLLEWEIGQRLTDLRAFRAGAEYDRKGVFRFWQSKTDSYVSVEISVRLRDMLNEHVADDRLFMFQDRTTGLAFNEERLSRVFGQVRAVAVKGGGRRLLMRWLRHSCVVQLGRKGCTVLEISSITGHSPAGASRILATYAPADSETARNAQRKRGLVA